MTNKSQQIYRVDKFVVPESAREEFLQKVQVTHERLRTLPGFVQDFILEQVSETAEFNIVTVVEWENKEAIEHAKEQIYQLYEEMNFNPKELFARLGIRADLGNYKSICT
jgi:hypothetical protein